MSNINHNLLFIYCFLFVIIIINYKHDKMNIIIINNILEVMVVSRLFLTITYHLIIKNVSHINESDNADHTTA